MNNILIDWLSSSSSRIFFILALLLFLLFLFNFSSQILAVTYQFWYQSQVRLWWIERSAPFSNNNSNARTISLYLWPIFVSANDRKRTHHTTYATQAPDIPYVPLTTERQCRQLPAISAVSPPPRRHRDSILLCAKRPQTISPRSVAPPQQSCQRFLLAIWPQIVCGFIWSPNDSEWAQNCDNNKPIPDNALEVLSVWASSTIQGSGLLTPFSWY